MAPLLLWVLSLSSWQYLLLLEVDASLRCLLLLQASTPSLLLPQLPRHQPEPQTSLLQTQLVTAALAQGVEACGYYVMLDGQPSNVLQMSDSHASHQCYSRGR